MIARIKQDRTRKAGYRGSLNAQDFPRTPRDDAMLMRLACAVALSMIGGVAKRSGWRDEPVVRRALDALGELKEWTKAKP